MRNAACERRCGTLRVSNWTRHPTLDLLHGGRRVDGVYLHLPRGDDLDGGGAAEQQLSQWLQHHHDSAPMWHQIGGPWALVYAKGNDEQGNDQQDDPPIPDNRHSSSLPSTPSWAFSISSRKSLEHPSFLSHSHTPCLADLLPSDFSRLSRASPRAWPVAAGQTHGQTEADRAASSAPDPEPVSAIFECLEGAEAVKALNAAARDAESEARRRHDTPDSRDHQVS